MAPARRAEPSIGTSVDEASGDPSAPERLAGPARLAALERLADPTAPEPLVVLTAPPPPAPPAWLAAPTARVARARRPHPMGGVGLLSLRMNTGHMHGHVLHMFRRPTLAAGHCRVSSPEDFVCPTACNSAPACTPAARKATPSAFLVAPSPAQVRAWPAQAWHWLAGDAATPRSSCSRSPACARYGGGHGDATAL